MPRHQICHQIFQKRFSQNPNDTNQIRLRHRHRPSFQLYYNHSILHHRYCKLAKRFHPTKNTRGPRARARVQLVSVNMGSKDSKGSKGGRLAIHFLRQT